MRCCEEFRCGDFWDFFGGVQFWDNDTNFLGAISSIHSEWCFWHYQLSLKRYSPIELSEIFLGGYPDTRVQGPPFKDENNTPKLNPSTIG